MNPAPDQHPPRLPILGRQRRRHVFELSPRETEVVRLIHAELHDKEIAFRLGISTGLVKFYAYEARGKLGLRTRIGLALWWERRTSRGERIPVE